MIDIDIKNEAGNFKLRASGIIIKNDKVLVQKSKKFDGFILPGGHIELGELSKEAILREIKEETELDVELKYLICLTENIYNGKLNEIFHEINYYYKLEPIKNIETKEFTIVENDKGTIKEQKFFWIDIDKLEESNVRPIEIVRLLNENKNTKDLILEIDNRTKR